MKLNKDENLSIHSRLFTHIRVPFYEISTRLFVPTPVGNVSSQPFLLAPVTYVVLKRLFDGEKVH